MQITKEYLSQNVELFITHPERFWEDATEIAENAFYNFDSIIRENKEEYFFKEIEIPNTISKIGANAFCDCDYLEKVVLPENLKVIEPGTFKYCPSLKEVILPSSLEEIGDEAFFECRLSEINFPENLTKIGKSAFTANDFETITFPNNLTHIQEYTFERCPKLKEINFNNVKIIGKNAFSDCYNLTKIILPETIDIVSSFAFCDCENLEYVEILNTNIKLGKQSFLNTKLVCMIQKNENTTILASTCSILETSKCTDLKDSIFKQIIEEVED